MDTYTTHSIELRNSNINSQPLVIEGSRSRKPINNLAKLGYREIFYQKKQQIKVVELELLQKKDSLHSFNTLKEIHEKGVKRFKQANSNEQCSNIGKTKRRGNSVDYSSIGAYYLNNWISAEEYPCQRPPPQQKSSHLIYQILNSQWTKALEIVSSLGKTSQIATLQFILRGFRTVQSMCCEQNPSFYEQFMVRQMYEIMVKSSSDSIGGYYHFVNVFEEQSKTKFAEIKSFPRKVQCLKINLDYLVTFAGRYAVKTEDDYIVLAFKLLGNSYDQEQPNIQPQKDFSKILLTLNIKLCDRLNFATKLLPQRKRKAFCNELENSLSAFPSLDNILFYVNSNSKSKEEKISQICQTYIDKYGDIETVAYLSIELPFLKKYFHQFKQILEFSDQYKELERLQLYRWSADPERSKDAINSKKNQSIASFFQHLNIVDEKITEPKVIRDNFNICQICSKKLQKNENYLQCGKCMHGGHPGHLLKWFQQSQNCPHIGCPCICNSY